MQSPPKAFGTPPPRTHTSLYATENPNINFLSPPRKRHRNNNHSTPRHTRISPHKSIHKSPISSRYQSRIHKQGTSLFDADTHHTHVHTPLRTGQKRKTNPKYLSSPISPTFEPIFHSPQKHSKNTHNSDRYTPNHGNLNRYNLHTPTKRFLHNDKNSINIIRPSPQKKRKLTQNYSGTNDDPNSLNHKLKQKLSQHTYNMVLQSELLGVSQRYHKGINSLTNIATNDDTQSECNNTDETTHTHAHILGINSPSLPNRRIKTDSNRPHSHHPLCPCYNSNNANDIGLDSEESEGNALENERQRQRHNNYDCVCDSITANVASDFLVSPRRTLRYNIYENEENTDNAMNMTPLKQGTQSQLNGTRKSMRNIAKSPFKVLDAPRLTDDFYLNLVDWSNSCNILSVGLGECVYLWSAYTSKVTKLVDLTKLFDDLTDLNELSHDTFDDGYDMVCSVGWNKNICIKETDTHTRPAQGTADNGMSDALAVGSGNGYVFIFDTVKSELQRPPLQKHNHRVGVISWKDSNVLCTGSRDRNIYLRDIRMKKDIICKLSFHKQEVCGLEWSHDSFYLASGGNDNKLAIWDMRNMTNVNDDFMGFGTKPLCFGKHKAAVKAITWSPHESGLIASGGGTADRCIKFWNINSFISSSNHTHASQRQTPLMLKPSEVIDTGSQVCNLLWSKNVNEIVSTHGYSLNQIVVWKYPSMDKIVTLTGHTYRVLYLAASPDGQTIVTGAGDETLRLWNVFPPPRNNGNDLSSFVPQPYSIPLHIR